MDKEQKTLNNDQRQFRQMVIDACKESGLSHAYGKIIWGVKERIIKINMIY